MGAADLRDAFNAALPADSGFSATRATLTYEQKHGTEFQVLTFYGNGSSGPFTVTADPVRREGDLIAACRQAAERLVREKGAQS